MCLSNLSWRDGTNDTSLCIASQGGLEDASQLGVTEGNVGTAGIALRDAKLTCRVCVTQNFVKFPYGLAAQTKSINLFLQCYVPRPSVRYCRSC